MKQKILFISCLPMVIYLILGISFRLLMITKPMTTAEIFYEVGNPSYTHGVWQDASPAGQRIMYRMPSEVWKNILPIWQFCYQYPFGIMELNRAKHPDVVDSNLLTDLTEVSRQFDIPPGSILYTRNPSLDRVDIEYPDGTRAYILEGERLTESEMLDRYR